MSTRFLFAFVVFLAGCGTAWPGEDTRDLEASVRDYPRAWVARGLYPVTVDVRSESGRPIRVMMSSRWSVMFRNATLPPRTATRFEFTSLERYSRVSVSSAGTEMNDSSVAPFFDYGYINGSYPAPLACLNSYLLRELELLDPADKPANINHNALTLDELPGRWQSYVGFVGILLLSPGEASSIRSGQREAIALWVRWFGGRVWLAGPGAAEAARTLGLDLSAAPPYDMGEGEVLRHSIGNGYVYVQPEADAAVLAAHLPSEQMVNPLSPYLMREHEYTYGPTWLFDTLAGLSTNLVIGCLLALGLIMGPLNYWFIRRRKNSLLFFVTTPLIAIVGTVVIFLGAYAEEGVGGVENRFAVLVRGDGTNDAMVFDAHGVRSGFFVPTPRFSDDSLVLPVQNERDELQTDLTDGVRLVSGWLKPRFPTGFVAIRPVVSRMNVSVTEENGVLTAVNDIGFAVSSMAAIDAEGAVHVAENITPGGRKPMRKLSEDDGEIAMSDLLLAVKKLTDGAEIFKGVTLIARCDGLPYLDVEGLSATLLDGEYYYVVAGGKKGVGP